jgi:hypothetical protein
MKTFLLTLYGTIAAFIAIQPSVADEAAPNEIEIKAAVAKSLPLPEAGARGSMEKRKQCFPCHNQGLPTMVSATARDQGFTIDAFFFWWLGQCLGHA